MKKYLKLLIGFPIGTMLLVVSYAIVYLVDGNEEYTHAISSFINVGSMLKQFVTAGVYFVIYLGLLQTLKDTLYKETYLTSKDVAKFVLTVFVMATVIFLTDKLIQFGSEEVEDCMLGISVIILIAISIVNMVANYINIKRINKRIKSKE